MPDSSMYDCSNYPNRVVTMW